VANYLRVREPGKHALLNPETGVHVTPKPEEEFTEDHPLVRAHPWAFGTDEEIRASSNSLPIEPVEQATRAPGERRAVPRRKAP